MKRGKNIFWGILFVLAAAALLVGQLGYLENFGFWTILFTIGLIGFLVDGIFHRSFGMILFSLAFLAILHDKLLGIEALTPWPVLGAAFLGTIGLNIIFPKAQKWKKYVQKNFGESSKDAVEYADGEQVHFECTFGEAVKYVTGRELSFVRLENAFGSLSVYFDNAGLKNGMAAVDVDCSFGCIVLYVPSDWRVNLSVTGTFGGVNEKGKCNPNGENCIQVGGEVAFGAVEVRYI